MLANFNCRRLQRYHACRESLWCGIGNHKICCWFGAVLLGDGKNNFNFSAPIKSGFYIPTDARAILPVMIQKTPTFVVTNNSDTVTVFQQSDR